MRTDAVEMLDDFRVERLLQKGDYFMTHFVAFDRSVVVRGVLAPRFAELFEVRLELRIATAEKGTHEADRSDRARFVDSRKGRALQLHKESLGDVVHVMSRRNRVELELLGHLGEESKARAPRGHLEGLAFLALDLDVNAFEGNAQPLRERTHEFVFFLRFFSESVIDVENDETLRYILLLSAFGHQKGERDRIRTAADGESDTSRR